MINCVVLAMLAAAAAQTVCPAGVPLVNCLVSPCRSSPCGAGETCVENYCGGCNYKCLPTLATLPPAPCDGAVCKQVLCSTTTVRVPANPALGKCCATCEAPCANVACTQQICDPNTQDTIPADASVGRCCPSCVPKTTTPCANVRCASPNCGANERIVPADPASGECCATCAPTSCAAVLCAALVCDPMTQITIAADVASGKCCPTCESKCLAVRCASPNCGANERIVPADPESGKCCASCEPAVKVCNVACIQLACDPNTQDTLPADASAGRCCPSCVPKTMTPCANVRCASPNCGANERIVPADPANGKCCATCAPTSCAAVLCAAVACDPTTQITIAPDVASGKCCPTCGPLPCAAEPQCFRDPCSSCTAAQTCNRKPCSCDATCVDAQPIEPCAGVTCDKCLTSRLANSAACCAKCTDQPCPAVKCALQALPPNCRRVQGTKCASCAVTCSALIVLKATSDEVVNRAVAALKLGGLESTITKSADGSYKLTLSADVDEMAAASYGRDASSSLAAADGIMSASLEAIVDATLSHTSGAAAAAAAAPALAALLALATAL